MSITTHRPAAPQPQTPAVSPSRSQRAWIWGRRALWPACIIGGLTLGLTTGHEGLGAALIGAAPAYIVRRRLRSEGNSCTRSILEPSAILRCVSGPLMSWLIGPRGANPLLGTGCMTPDAAAAPGPGPTLSLVVISGFERTTDM